jgi:hypothetical protein
VRITKAKRKGKKEGQEGIGLFDLPNSPWRPRAIVRSLRSYFTALRRHLLAVIDQQAARDVGNILLHARIDVG